MGVLDNYGLIRFKTKSGEVDKVMTAIGRGVIQLWALQNTPKGTSCVIVNIDTRETFAEYVGTEDGIPEICKNPDAFNFDIPDGAWEIFSEEVAKRAADV